MEVKSRLKVGRKKNFFLPKVKKKGWMTKVLWGSLWEIHADNVSVWTKMLLSPRLVKKSGLRTNFPHWNESCQQNFWKLHFHWVTSYPTSKILTVIPSLTWFLGQEKNHVIQKSCYGSLLQKISIAWLYITIQGKISIAWLYHTIQRKSVITKNFSVISVF